MNGNVKRLAMANEPNIFQMLLVLFKCIFLFNPLNGADVQSWDKMFLCDTVKQNVISASFWK